MTQRSAVARAQPTEFDQLIDRTCERWSGEDSELLHALAKDLGMRDRETLVAVTKAEIKAYLTRLPEASAANAARSLRRLFWEAHERGWRDRSPLAAPRPLPASAPIVLARFPEVASIVAHMGEGRARSTRAEYERALAHWVTWCDAHKVDPVRCIGHQVRRYYDELNEQEGRIPWSDLSALRAFFELAIRMGLRTSQPLPRRGRRGILSQRDGPLTSVARHTIRSYSVRSRPSAESLLTEYVETVRDAGLDPLNVSLDGFEILFKPARRSRLRPILSRFFAFAAERGLVGEGGASLRQALVRRTLTGNRRVVAPYRAFAKAQGHAEPGLVPLIERERYLSGLAADGYTKDDIAAARSIIVGLEHKAAARGLRPARPDRINRLVARITTLGVSEEEATTVVDALHDGLKPSVHRSVEAGVARYLTWCVGLGIDPTNPSNAELLRFESEMGDHLRLMPVRRFLAGWASIGRQAARAQLATRGARKSRALVRQAT